MARLLRSKARSSMAQQEDRISGLPDDLLLRILLGLGCARAAARAGLVSGRWRGLWAQLREIRLVDVSPESCYDALGLLEAALVTGVRAGRLDILHVEPSILGVSRSGAASLLRRAARLAPVELKMFLFPELPLSRDRESVIMLPCFVSTKSIDLRLRNFQLAPPPDGELFLELVQLALRGCRFNPAALLPRCPRLRVLEIGPDVELAATAAVISLPFLEELVVAESFQASRLQVEAPLLKHFSLSSHIDDVSISAPKLEKLTLDCDNHVNRLELSNLPQLRELVLVGIHRFAFNDLLSMGNGVARFMKQLPDLHLLRISMSLAPRPPRYFSNDWLEALPKTSVLTLELKTYGQHVYPATVLHLLAMAKGIEELTLLLDHPSNPEGECSQDCSCHYSRVLNFKDFSLPTLRKVEFKGFNGAKCAFNILENLLSTAKMLEQVLVTLCNKDPASNKTHKHQLFDIFNAYPSVRCHVLNA